MHLTYVKYFTVANLFCHAEALEAFGRFNGLFAHTAQALATSQVSATIPNAVTCAQNQNVAAPKLK